MWDPCVEVIARLDEFIPDDTALYTRLYLFKSQEAGFYLVSGELAQWSLLCVVFHLNHHVLHSLHIADQTHQVLTK